MANSLENKSRFAQTGHRLQNSPGVRVGPILTDHAGPGFRFAAEDVAQTIGHAESYARLRDRYVQRNRTVM